MFSARRAFQLVALVTGLQACRGGEPASGSAPAQAPGLSRTVGPLDSTRGVVFAVGRVPALLEQCSRPAPADVVGYWTPSAVQIRALEARLPAELVQHLKQAAPDFAARVRPDDYYRQYGGIVHRGGLRTIYVNGFHQSHVESRNEFLAANRAHPEQLDHFPTSFRGPNWWHGVAGGVCDGGEAFFGVEFDPSTQTFRAFHFNGHA